MRKKTKALLMQLPGVLMLIVAVLGAFYIKIFKPSLLPMFWATPTTLLIILIFYFWGRYLEKKASNEYY